MRCTRRERSRSRGASQSADETEDLGAGGSWSSATSKRISNTSPQLSAGIVPEVHVLYASPLSPVLPQLNVQPELDAIREATHLAQTKGRLRMEVGIATKTALAQLLTRGRAGGQQLVLHLSAHVVRDQQGGDPRLVLETEAGGAHMLRKEDLESLLNSGPRLEGMPLVFLSSCWSQGIAELFTEAGCRHVIATRGEVRDSAARVFTKQFYYALCCEQSVRSSWTSAQQLLKPDDENLFVLFGQPAADKTRLIGVAKESRSDREAASAMEAVAAEAHVLPPRVEDFVGRRATMSEVLTHFEAKERGGGGRRACVVYGPVGIGKSAVAAELAHFASAPGRLFSRGVFFVSLRGATSVGQVQDCVCECLRRTIQEPLVGLEEKAGPSTCSSSSQPTFVGSSGGSSSSVGARTSPVLRAFQRLERQGQRGRQLLILDDAAGAMKGSVEVRDLLSGLLEGTQGLCIAAFSRESVYESLGSFKSVNVLLQPLSDTEAAHLLLRRCHRPLHPRDFDFGASGQVPLRQDRQMVQDLSLHPLLKQLGGHPGNLCSAGQRVTPDLGSLMDLCGLYPVGGLALQRSLSVDQGRAVAGQALQRMMSVDEGGQEAGSQKQDSGSAGRPLLALARSMSVDDGPQGAPVGGIPRLMSIDEQ